jgi:hypothetical protein
MKKSRWFWFQYLESDLAVPLLQPKGNVPLPELIFPRGVSFSVVTHAARQKSLCLLNFSKQVMV